MNREDEFDSSRYDGMQHTKKTGCTCPRPDLHRALAAPNEPDPRHCSPHLFGDPGVGGSGSDCMICGATNPDLVVEPPTVVHLAQVFRLSGRSPVVLTWCGAPAEAVALDPAAATCEACKTDRADAIRAESERVIYGRDLH